MASGRLPGGEESWEVGPHELDKCSQKHQALCQSWRSRLRPGMALPSAGGGDTEVQLPVTTTSSGKEIPSRAQWGENWALHTLSPRVPEG